MTSTSRRVTAAATAGGQRLPGRRPRRPARRLAALGAAAALPAAGVLMLAGPAAATGYVPGHFITPTNVVTGPGDPMTFHSYTYSNDGTQIDETATTTFVLDGNPCNANVCSTDVPGSHTVTAEIPGWNPTATVQVLTPDHLAISPAYTQVHAGDTVTYTVTRVTADGTVIDDVTAGATITVDGVACPQATCLATTAGQHTVTATYTGTVNGATQSLTGGGAISVLPALIPAASPVPPGVVSPAAPHSRSHRTAAASRTPAARPRAARAPSPGTYGQVTGTGTITISG